VQARWARPSVVCERSQTAHLTPSPIPRDVSMAEEDPQPKDVIHQHKNVEMGCRTTQVVSQFPLEANEPLIIIPIRESIASPDKDEQISLWVPTSAIAKPFPISSAEGGNDSPLILIALQRLLPYPITPTTSVLPTQFVGSSSHRSVSSLS
jgi:hypothetical protein